MNEPLPESIVNYWGDHRLALLIIIAVTVAVGLVSTSMYLYISSGAIQLDLSRPGYQGVSSQTDSSYKTLENYPETGALDGSSLTEFEGLLSSQAIKAKAIDAFSGDPLDPVSLGIKEATN